MALSDFMITFVALHPLAFWSIILVASLAVLILASDKALYGVTRYAERLGLSDYLIGLIIISLGASMPELVSSIMGAVAGDSGIILGTILGSNVTGITLVVGISAIVGKKLVLNPHVLEKTEIITIATVILPFLLILDGRPGRIDAGIMIAAYLFYVGYLWKKEGEAGSLKKDVKFERIYLDGIIFILALAAILLSARWVVKSSIEISSLLNLSSYIVALIVIGIGASMPDLAVGVRSLMKGHKGIGIGNALGSIVVKSLLFLGILAMISPIAVSPWTIAASQAILVAGLGLIFYLTTKKMMTWKSGLVLLGLYATFIVVNLVIYYVG